MTRAPTRFSWVLDGTLAGMAVPDDLVEALKFLDEEGVGCLVSLTRKPLDEVIVNGYGLDYHHLPIPDFSPPTQGQADEFVRIVDEARERGVGVAVHCIAGMGRTGTMLACYLVSRGDAAIEAIRRVRRLRPGSIETSEQEQAVHDYAARVSRR